VNWKINVLLFAIFTLSLTSACQRDKEESKNDLSIALADTTEIESTSQPETSSYDYIKVFEWLVGDWKDESKDANITYKYEWDENKNFLKQHFSIIIPDQENLHGIQILGWDPVKKQIRSWIFDSDGGFGESFWSKEGDKWYATTTYTLPDGTIASAIHVFSKVNENSYTFSSESREIGGELLPDVGPFTIVRQNQGNKND
jgi:hypothetical protein